MHCILASAFIDVFFHAVSDSVEHTFVLGVDDKFILAAEPAGVNKLSLPSWHQNNRSSLI